MNTPFDFMPQSCKMANRIMQWLLTLALSPPSSQSLADRQREPHLSLREVGWVDSGCFLSGPGCICWPLGHRSGWRGIVGEKGKQLWGFQDGGAGSQDEERGRLPRLGTHRALSEARACTQHRCWKRLGKGIQKRRVGQSRKEGMQTLIEEQIVQTIINPVFVLDRKWPAIVKWRGKKQQAKLSHLEAAEMVSFVSCGCLKPDWIWWMWSWNWQFLSSVLPLAAD